MPTFWHDFWSAIPPPNRLLNWSRTCPIITELSDNCAPTAATWVISSTWRLPDSFQRDARPQPKASYSWTHLLTQRSYSENSLGESMSLPTDILGHVIKEISGDGYGKLVMTTPDRPDARFFVGVLRPAGIDPSDDTDEETSADPKLAVEPASPEDMILEEEPIDPGERLRTALSKFSPSSVGIRFAVPKTLIDKEITVGFEFAVMVPCAAAWEDVKGNFSRPSSGRIFIPKAYKRLLVRGTAGGFTPTEAMNDPQGVSERGSRALGKAPRGALRAVPDAG